MKKTYLSGYGYTGDGKKEIVKQKYKKIVKLYEVNEMYILYNLILFILLIFYTPFILYNLLQGRYREGFKERWGILPKNIIELVSKNEIIWIHAASVGETRAAEVLVDKIKEKYPEYKIIFSTMTDTGREIAKKSLNNIDGLIYLPLDFSWIVRKVVKKINPELLITIETEIWPNLIKEAAKNNTRIMVASGRISDDSIKKYKYLGPLLAKTLEKVDVFSMQTDLDVDRIISLGAAEDKVLKTGNIKYDQQSGENSIDKDDILQQYQIKEEQPVLVAGSTHEGEEKQLLSLYKNLKRDFPDLVMLLAPRYIERTENIARIFNQQGINTVLRTEIEQRNPEKESVILVNTIGELAALYGIGDLIFVGGSLIDRGGHNILEPAAQGKPVFFGPSMYNFKQDTKFLLKHEIGIQVKNIDQLTDKMRYFLKHPRQLKQKGKKAEKIIENNQGSAAASIELIANLLKKKFIQVNKILLIRLSAIGDVIHALPAARAVRKAYPEAEISWLVENKARELVETNPNLDHTILFPKNTWKKEFKNNKLKALKEVRTYFKKFRKKEFDLVLDLHGLFKSALPAYLSKSKILAGSAEGREGSTLFYDKKIQFSPGKIHQVDKNLELASGIGGNGKKVNFDIVNTLQDRENINHLFKKWGLANISGDDSQILAAINPCTTWESKNWIQEKYVELADKLINKYGCQVIFTGGPGDIAYIKEIVNKMEEKAYNAAGKTSIRELAVLYKKADVYIGGDTGPMHLAAAVELPVIALMGPTDPATHGPYGSNNIVIQKELDCKNCWQRKCKKGYKCMQEIEVEEVLQAFCRMFTDLSS
ncbi:MAG: glycosyltransferase N-terminal domain-containing protein [Bacillota bacterium]